MLATKLLIAFLSCVAGTLFGLALSKRLTRRRRYFEELISLINLLESDLRFKQENISILLDASTAHSVSKVRTNALEFIAYAGGGGALSVTKHDLTRREFAVVAEFFQSLGTLDLSTQLFVFDNYRTKLKEFYEAADRAERAMGKSYVKLGFLMGLAAGIMLL
ncbi:MAG: stage III sporulation protein AB [Clostridiales bacterium]|jgi:hypothetical protein|nr:stage III sporulation protein AB [Clostridiales bacterium]